MKKQNGSALLLVLVVISVFGVLVQSWWHRASQLLEIMHLREQYYTNRYATEAVLEWGITHAKKNFNMLCVAKKETVIDLTHLNNHIFPLPNDDTSIRLIVKSIQEKTPRLDLKVTLKQKENIACTISCLLTRHEQNRFVVSHYSLGAFV